MNRRTFLKAATGAAAVLAFKRRAFAYAVSPPLRKFVVPLPSIGAGIPVAQKISGRYSGVDYYEIAAGWFRQQLHPDLPNPTRLYGYQNASVGFQPSGEMNNGVHLAGTILANKGTPVRIKFVNRLPARHIIPFDPTIPMLNAEGRQDRAAIHLHGGLVPWASDGGPFHWIGNPENTSNVPLRGPSVVDWLPDNTGSPTADYYYPNNQSARFMWFHDHAVGNTRTSAYAGLASGYVITDLIDRVLSSANLPTEYLVVQDKVFWKEQADPDYPNAVEGVRPGDLWYPHVYDTNIWERGDSGEDLPPVSVVAEMFGDTMLVNGVVFPFKNANRALYRLRVINSCNARFLDLRFVMESSTTPGEPAVQSNGNLVPAPVDIWQIGTEGGFMSQISKLFTAGVPVIQSALTLGPAERADLLVDFSKVPANSKVLLYSDAAAPHPDESAKPEFFDWFYGKAGVLAGHGPNTRTLMQFRFGTTGTTVGDIPVALARQLGPRVVTTLPTAPDPDNGGLMMVPAMGSTSRAQTGQTITLSTGQKYVYEGNHSTTLNEAFDGFGRLAQLIGTTAVNPATGELGREYLDPPTEFIRYNRIFIWEIFNLTADTHPMHFHQFNVRVLRRRPFDAENFTGIPVYTARGLGPEPGELGWKETVRVYPGMCTTVALLVEDPLPGRKVTVKNASGAVVGTGTLPPSPRLTSAPYNLSAAQADEYVWHCHILEHEEHDMMRPLVAGS